jgi:hypothetical protein
VIKMLVSNDLSSDEKKMSHEIRLHSEFLKESP